MHGNLIDILDQLESIDDSDQFNPMVIFAEGGSSAVPTANTIVCPGNEEGTRECPQDPKPVFYSMNLYLLLFQWVRAT